ncbi:TelA-like protein [compost metagenome]
MQSTETKTIEIEVVKPNDAANIVAYKDQLNLDDSTSVISWGTGAQKKVGQINAQMLEGVRSKDAGEIGASLVSMVTQMRGLDFGKVSEKQGFFGKLLGKITPLAEFVQSFETISSQVEAVANKLESHKVELLKSIKSLDILYVSTLDYFHELGNYIAAGEEILKELDEVRIPELKTKAETGDMLDAQNLNDLIAKRDAFDRRVHDLRLTRQVVMQTLPQIRMVQSNDNGLVQKIDTQILNTIPMWESQLVIAVEQWKMAEATKTTKAVSDLQNELLVKNAEMLKQGNAEARREIERGVYDIESVKKANDLLIATIEESIAITQEGRANRIAAANVLVEAEGQLKTALRSAA